MSLAQEYDRLAHEARDIIAMHIEMEEQYQTRTDLPAHEIQNALGIIDATIEDAVDDVLAYEALSEKHVALARKG